MSKYQGNVGMKKEHSYITQAAVFPPQLRTGIPSTCGPRMGFPNPRALAAVASAQPFPRGASLDLP